MLNRFTKIQSTYFPYLILSRNEFTWNPAVNSDVHTTERCSIHLQRIAFIMCSSLPIYLYSLLLSRHRFMCVCNRVIIITTTNTERLTEVSFELHIHLFLFLSLSLYSCNFQITFYTIWIQWALCHGKRSVFVFNEKLIQVFIEIMLCIGAYIFQCFVLLHYLFTLLVDDNRIMSSNRV